MAQQRHPFPATLLPRLVLAAALVAPWAGSLGETVYKYIGDDGAVIYTDSPPGGTTDYEEIVFRDYPARDPEAHREVIEQMAETTDRLQADRREREKEQRAEPALAAPPVVYYPRPESYREGYIYPRYPFHKRRHREPRPPYRIDRDMDSRDKRLRELRTPITIPSFGTGETIRERANR